MDRDELQAMREGVAKEYGFSLYRRYSEPEAAHFLSVDVSTLKRWRRAGKTPAVNMGERQVRYLGLHIADMMIKGAEWQSISDVPSKSGPTGSPSAPEAPPTTAHGSTAKPTKPDVHRLAQTTFRKRNAD